MNNGVVSSTKPIADTATRTLRARAERAKTQGHSRASAALPREASRLLAALAEEGADAVVDPVEDGRVIVRTRGRGGVSLGRGQYPIAQAEALVSRDLALWARGLRRVLTITETGRAHLRREAGARAGAEPLYFEQHRETVVAMVDAEEGGGREQVRVDADESPLAWLRRRKDRDGAPFLDAASFEAGERLRRDLTFAGMLPRVTQAWGQPAGRGRGGGFDPAGATDTAVAARQRATRALDAVGPDTADLLMDVCGFLKGLALVERERDWPPRSGKVVLRLALARLADHYGLEREARGPAASRGVRSWRAVVLDGGLA